MTQWEYCVIDIGPEGQAKVVYLKPSGGKHRAEKIEEIYQVVAELGLAGWELVSHTQTVSEYYTFKRQVETDD